MKVVKDHLKCVYLFAVNKQEPHVIVRSVSKPLCFHAFDILLLSLGSRMEGRVFFYFHIFQKGVCYDQLVRPQHKKEEADNVINC